VGELIGDNAVFDPGKGDNKDTGVEFSGDLDLEQSLCGRSLSINYKLNITGWYHAVLVIFHPQCNANNPRNRIRFSRMISHSEAAHYGMQV